ncbi:hypothetical protein KXV85_009513, partial [Aspergillus fumigatus]
RKAGAAIAGGLDIGNGNVANLAVNVKTVVIECPNAAMKFSASIVKKKAISKVHAHERGTIDLYFRKKMV